MAPDLAISEIIVKITDSGPLCTVSGSFKTKTSQSTDGLNLIQEILLEIQKKSNELIEKAEEYSVWAYSRVSLISFKK